MTPSLTLRGALALRAKRSNLQPWGHRLRHVTPLIATTVTFASHDGICIEALTVAA